MFQCLPLCRLPSQNKSLIKLECDNEKCDREFISRWFSSVTSLLLAGDDEFELLLDKWKTLSFEVKSNVSISIIIENVTHRNEIPVVIGSQLYFMCNTMKKGETINANNYKEWKSTNKDVPFRVSCPLCSFTDYIPLGCFYINKKLLMLPIFAFVDKRRYHLRSGLITAYDGNIQLQETKSIELQKLACIRDKIGKYVDNFSNLCFYTTSKCFAKIIDDRLKHAMKQLRLADERNDRVDYVNVKLKEKYRRQINKQSILRKAIVNITQIILNDSVTAAVSQRTQFKINGNSGQSNETEINGRGIEAQLKKSSLDDRKGYVRNSSRYIAVQPNNPLSVLSILKVSKLISNKITTNTHQILHHTALAYVCKLNTSDGKNVGSVLELLPGISFTSPKDCTSVEQLKLMLNSISTTIAKKRKNNNVIEKCLTEVSETCREMEPYYPLKHKQPKTIKCKPSNMSSKEISNDIIIFLPDFSTMKISGDIDELEIFIMKCILKKSGINTPLSVFVYRQQRICIIYPSDYTIIDERFGFTPTTREWLLSEKYDEWKQRLCPSIDGNVPMFGSIACRIQCVNQNSTNKLIAGVCAMKHNIGLPVKCRVLDSVYKRQGLAYPQNDLINSKSCTVPSQNAFVLFAAFGGDNVEDGIIVNKKARDFGFGATFFEIEAQVSVTVLPSEECVIFVKDQDGNMIEFLKLFGSSADGETNLLSYKYAIHENSVICELSGIWSIESYSSLLSHVVYRNSYRLYYKNYYTVGDSDSRKKVFYGISVQANGRLKFTITFHIQEYRLLECGDKYSNLYGQKSTVVRLASPEDMLFLGNCHPSLPRIPDIIINTACLKRQTPGMINSGALNMYKLANIDTFDLSEFCGDKSVKHDTLLRDILSHCASSNDYGLADVFRGTTGSYAGKGQLFMIPIIRYIQDGYNHLYYTPVCKPVKRSINTGIPVRGRGKLGGQKFSASELFELLAGGYDEDVFRQLQNSESTFDTSKLTGCVSQSFVNICDNFACLGISIEPEIK